MNLTLAHWIMYALGVLTGGLIWSPTFRVKFFKGLRKFLAQISKGAEDMNRKAGKGPGR